jgi:acyl-coenzyme A thioesterase PaaI-like protein
MPHLSTAPIVLEPEYIEGFRQIYEEKIVFNKTLGLKLVSVTPEAVEARIDMRAELVGHYAYNRIHGGVISAVLDAIGSAAVMAALAAKHMDEAPRQAPGALCQAGHHRFAGGLFAPGHRRVLHRARQCAACGLKGRLFAHGVSRA